VDEIIDTERINKYVKKNKDKYENIVVLWIGGSALGTRAIMNALKWKYYNELSRKKRWDNPKLYILDNVDPDDINHLLKTIKLKETLFIVISKSGWTIETVAMFSFFKKLVKQEGLDLTKHFTIVAWETSDFKEKCLKKWYDVFDVPDWIGGRFSAFTDVWLLPLAFIWIDIEQILSWLKSIKKTLLSDNIFENPSLLTAIIQYHSYFELNKNITVFFPYSTNLFYLWEWYKQMMWESLWKWWIWVTTTSAIWSTDQHSQIQLYYDWPNDKLITFLEVEDFGIDFKIDKEEKLSFKQLLDTEKYWTEESISGRNKINYTIKIDTINEKTLWELIAMLEVQTAILWEFYGFNPFDQPWVEIGKNITKQKLLEDFWEIKF
jgi:glucose-6-phosphate isomerase